MQDWTFRENESGCVPAGFALPGGTMTMGEGFGTAVAVPLEVCASGWYVIAPATTTTASTTAAPSFVPIAAPSSSVGVEPSAVAVFAGIALLVGVMLGRVTRHRPRPLATPMPAPSDDLRIGRHDQWS